MGGDSDWHICLKWHHRLPSPPYFMCAIVVLCIISWGYNPPKDKNANLDGWDGIGWMGNSKEIGTCSF